MDDPLSVTIDSNGSNLVSQFEPSGSRHRSEETDRVSTTPSSTTTRLLLAYGLLVTSWRVLALVRLEDSPLSSADPSSAEVGLLLARNLMGLGLVALGLLAVIRVGSRASSVFALFSVSAGIYFGGPVPVANELLQDAIWLVYFLAGSLLASAAFLHFMLIYPKAIEMIQKRGPISILYLPVVVGAILSILILALPSQSSLRGSLRGVFFTLNSWVATTFVGLALVLIPLRYIRALPRDRRRFGLDLVVLGFGAGFLPWAIATAIERLFPSLQNPAGVGSEALSLLFVFVPMGICSALLHGMETGLHSSPSEP